MSVEGTSTWLVEPAVDDTPENLGSDPWEERRSSLESFSRYFYISERRWAREKETSSQGRADPTSVRSRLSLVKPGIQKALNPLHFLRGSIQGTERLLAIIDHDSKTEFDVMVYSLQDTQLFAGIKAPPNLRPRELMGYLFATVSPGYATPAPLENAICSLRRGLAHLPGQYEYWLREAQQIPTAGPEGGQEEAPGDLAPSLPPLMPDNGQETEGENALTVISGEARPVSSQGRISVIVDNRGTEEIYMHKEPYALCPPQAEPHPGEAPVDRTLEANRPFYEFAKRREGFSVQGRFNHKVGVLWQRSHQVEEWQLYSNQLVAEDEIAAVVGPRAYQEERQANAVGDAAFPAGASQVDDEVLLLRYSLNLLGHAEVLKLFRGRSEGLKVGKEASGRFTFYEGKPHGVGNTSHQVLYHVAPLIPGRRTEDDIIIPKRHVGNDPVMVVIQTGEDCHFSATKCIDTYVTKVVIVIKARFVEEKCPGGGSPDSVTSGENTPGEGAPPIRKPVFTCRVLSHHSIGSFPPKVTRAMASSTGGVSSETMRTFLQRKIVNSSMKVAEVRERTANRDVREELLPQAFLDGLREAKL